MPYFYFPLQEGLADCVNGTRLQLDRSSLGLAYLEAGNDELAVPHLQATLPLDRDGNLHFRLGRALQKLGRTEEAQVALTGYRELQASSAQASARAAEITPP